MKILVKQKRHSMEKRNLGMSSDMRMKINFMGKIQLDEKKNYEKHENDFKHF